jgi:hypothetical protein
MRCGLWVSGFLDCESAVSGSSCPDRSSDLSLGGDVNKCTPQGTTSPIASGDRDPQPVKMLDNSGQKPPTPTDLRRECAEELSLFLFCCLQREVSNV